MWQLSQVDADTPIWMLVALHVMLSIGSGLPVHPRFTTGLNPLPPYLYSHGSAIMATLQQVAGAAGNGHAGRDHVRSQPQA